MLKTGLPALIVLFALACTLPLSLFSESQLSGNSPFLPPGYGDEEPEKPEPVVQTQGPISRELEFRGIIQLGGVYQFSIFNKKEQKGYWLKENATEDGISVNSYDANASTIVIVMNGRSERLALMAATESPIPVKQDAPKAIKRDRLPPQLRNQKQGNSTNRKTVPRRRVILPKKN